MKSTSAAASKTASLKAASASTAKAAPKQATPPAMKPALGVNEVEQMIATAAYYRAEKRSFEVGYELEDWLMAEKEISQLLSA
jgi:hypothetical protein